MSEHQDSPTDLFGNPIAEQKGRRTGSASRRRVLAHETAVSFTAPVVAVPIKVQIARRPVRFYRPAKWSYFALAVSLVVLVAAAALKIPLAKTPVVELDLTTSDSRTTIGLMSMVVFGCAVWSICEALATIAFNAGLKTSRKPFVCASKQLKVIFAGAIALVTLAAPICAVWLTWKYTHPQIRYVVALLDEFRNNPPGDIETGAIVDPTEPKSAPREGSTGTPEMQENVPSLKKPVPTIDPIDPRMQKLPTEQPPPKLKSRRNLQAESPDKDWIEKVDRWFTEIFSPSEDPPRQVKRK